MYECNDIIFDSWLRGIWFRSFSFLILLLNCAANEKSASMLSIPMVNVIWDSYSLSLSHFHQHIQSRKPFSPGFFRFWINNLRDYFASFGLISYAADKTIIHLILSLWGFCFACLFLCLHFFWFKFLCLLLNYRISFSKICIHSLLEVYKMSINLISPKQTL